MLGWCEVHWPDVEVGWAVASRGGIRATGQLGGKAGSDQGFAQEGLSEEGLTRGVRV